jgi:hypothetical protein
LGVVYGFHSFQDLRIIAYLPRHMDQGFDIFGKAASAIADTAG